MLCLSAEDRLKVLDVCGCVKIEVSSVEVRALRITRPPFSTSRPAVAKRWPR